MAVITTLDSAMEHQLLSPDDPCQTPGRRPRLYPVRELPVGGWFRVGSLTAANSARIAVATLKRQDSSKRLEVRKQGPDAWVCVRVA